MTIALREHGTIGAALAVGDEALARRRATLAEFARTPTRRPGGERRHRARPCSVGPPSGTAHRSARLRREARDPPRTRSARRARHRAAVRRDGATRSTPDPDAIVISPGPGDPRDLAGTVETLRGLVGRKPLFGVCLGHQLLALACGAQTFKLPYGHRGGNQPVKTSSATRCSSRRTITATRSTRRRCRTTSKRRWSISTTVPTKASGIARCRSRRCSFIPKPRPDRSMRAGLFAHGSTSLPRPSAADRRAGSRRRRRCARSRCSG